MRRDHPSGADVAKVRSFQAVSGPSWTARDLASPPHPQPHPGWLNPWARPIFVYVSDCPTPLERLCIPVRLHKPACPHPAAPVFKDTAALMTYALVWWCICSAASCTGWGARARKGDEHKHQRTLLLAVAGSCFPGPPYPSQESLDVCFRLAWWCWDQ